MSEAKWEILHEGNSVFSVSDDQGAYYGDLSYDDAKKLLDYIRETGLWKYDDLADYMGWPK